ncbi:uncharacterized protein LOC112905866 [Agrilus planipennis]|uniref:Uncharacterized protein LOC112905866 n=1 Tax=Agrilus planipennis TaxID=224129 RepID=A0A7F5RFY4_AGRPL|nr:uncharacterized protein LOC112905866 [Agrilus planipennis]
MKIKHIFGHNYEAASYLFYFYYFQPLSFTQQLQQCTRGGKTRPLSKLLSPLQSEPQSPIYASPPLSPVHDAPSMFGAMNIYQPVLRHSNIFSQAPDTHFARDTHMRIILGNSAAPVSSKSDKKNSQGQDSNNGNQRLLNRIVIAALSKKRFQRKTKGSLLNIWVGCESLTIRSLREMEL